MTPTAPGSIPTSVRPLAPISVRPLPKETRR